MTVQAICFDLFDTLVDLHMDRLPVVEIAGRRVPSTLGALHEALEAFERLPFDEFVSELRASDKALYRSHHGEGLELPTLRRFEAFCARIGVGDPAAPALLTETHMGRLREQVRILPHHRDVLGGLRERYRLAVVSNFSHTPLALQVLDEAGLRGDLDPIVISEDVGIRKPRPEIFQAALDALDLPAAQVVHVGDNLGADIEGAAALGMRTVWLTRRVPDPADALDAHPGKPPDGVIADLRELADWLHGRPPVR